MCGLSRRRTHETLQISTQSSTMLCRGSFNDSYSTRPSSVDKLTHAPGNEGYEDEEGTGASLL